MTDIDFDELDKAVNNLMGNVGKERTDDTPQEKTFNISSTLKPGEKPAYDKLEEAAKKIGSETLIAQGERTTVEDLHAEEEPPVDAPTPDTSMASVPPVPEVVNTPEPVVSKPTVPAARRPNSGRFMDVVHPSSDMKTATPATAAALVVPAREVEKATPPSTAKSPEPVSVPSPAAPPISDPAPLTPFLPDAKVEKRPLGGPNNAAGPVTANEEVSEETKGDESNQALEEKDVLKSDLIDTASKTPKDDFDNQKLVDATSVVSEQSAQEKRLQTIESEQAEATPAPEVSIAAVESGDTESLSTGPIPVAKASEGGKEDAIGDIYSVKSDNQPLSHPAKQKSGWGVVIIIIVIIIVCAALGAAAYFILGMGT